MHTTAPTAPHTLERHIADSLAAAKAFDAKAMQAITDGDRATATGATVRKGKAPYRGRRRKGP